MEQVETYGLTTVRAAVRLLGAGDEGQARRVLQCLRDEGRLFLHRTGAPETPFEYYTSDRRPLHDRELRDRYGVLAFSVFTQQRRPLLGRARFSGVMGKVAEIAELKEVAFRPCYRHRASANEPERLSLIRVGRTHDLQATVEELDQFVSSPAFRPWYYLAIGGNFVLTYLLPSTPESVNELARWVRRRAVLCRLGAKPVPVPVYVYEAKAPA